MVQPGLDDFDHHTRHGVALVGNGKVEEAVAAFRRAVATRPGSAEAHSNLGIALMHQGKNDEAIAAYQRALTLKPDFSEAQSNFGIALRQQGKVDEAVAAFRRAVVLKPDYAEAYSNLGNILRENGQTNEAIAVYRKALALKPEVPEVHLNLGIALSEWGDIERAITAFQQAIAFKPNYAEAHYYLAKAFKQRGRTEAAITAYRHAVALNADHIDSHLGLGLALLEQHELEGAVTAFRRAATLNPASPENHSNLGIALFKKGEIEAAMAAFGQAIIVNPDSPSAYSNLAAALSILGKVEEAIVACERAISLKPDYAEAHFNLSVILKDQGKIEEAIAAARRAIDLKPDYLDAHGNLGVCHGEAGRVEEAIAAFRAAIAVDPDAAEAHFNLSLQLLSEGNYREGWVEYEWRMKGGVKEYPLRTFTQPRWEGEDLSIKTLLIHAEQGLGDALQFVRFVTAVARRAYRVVLEVHEPLVELFRSCLGTGVIVVAMGKELPAFDVHLPLVSLPLVLGTTIETIPSEFPYLLADPARTAAWRNRLAPDGAGLRVGLRWSGSPLFKRERDRSTSLGRWQPVLETPGVDWYSLQVGDRADEFSQLPSVQIHDLSSRLTDFSETAAVIANLDLVITTDTSVAHLAGAMGKPVWIALKHVPDWRWKLAEESSPWYPTARLFRQGAPGDWDEVFARIAAALTEFAAGRTTATEATVNDPVDCFRRGSALQQCGKITDALAAYRRALALKPDYAEAHSHLGAALGSSGDIDGAIRELRQALDLNPDDAQSWTNLGVGLKAKGDTEAAIIAYRRAIGADPRYARAHFDLGITLKETGSIDEAIDAYRQAIALKPDHAEAISNLGIALRSKGMVDEAIATFHQAVAVRPDYSEAYSNLGVALGSQGHIDAAIFEFRRAIKVKSDYAEAHFNLGVALEKRGDIDEAIMAYRQAIAVKRDHAPAHLNLSLALLLRGDFAEGWREYEWRWKVDAKLNTSGQFGRPQWRGEDISGKTLLLHTEQGFGDTLQFVRFVPELVAKGARIVLGVMPDLVALLHSVRDAEIVGSSSAELPQFDYQLPLLSAPLLLGTTAETIPAEVPYLAPDSETVTRWRDRISSAGFRIGIAWQGWPNTTADEGRSLPLRCFSVLAQLPGVRLISLQKNHGLEQLTDLPEGMRVETLGPDYDAGTFLDTAAVMMNLDFVITSDTSVAHLAGALGQPVWIALKHVPDWRWMLDREDSPWYPTARLFRQRQPGDWDGVFERMTTELKQVISGGKNDRP